MNELKKILSYVFLSFLVFGQNERPATVDGIAAVVGERVVLKSDVNQMVLMAAVQQQLDPAKDLDRIKLLQNQAIQGLVDQKILLEMAELDSVVVEEKEVNQALDQQVEMFVAQAGGEERAETMLGQSLRSFRREYWYEMRDKLITERFQQQMISSISISRGEVVSFFNTYKDSIPSFPNKMKIRHLLIKISPGIKTKEATRKQLINIRKQILGGAPFDSLAMKYSQDPGSAASGGSLGYVKRGSLVGEFESVAFTLDLGSISEPIESPFGFHIIETLDKRGDKIHTRHILLYPELSPEDESRAYQLALSLKDSIENMSDFKRLVENYSDDLETQKIGGDLGWIDLENYPIAEFRLVANQLERNTANGPLKTDLGYHLLWLEGVQAGGRPSLENHWFDLESLALNHKRMGWYGEWISSARDDFSVTIYK